MRFMACLIALGVGAAVSTAQEQPTSQPAGEARPAALDPSTMSESDLIQEAQRRRTTGQIVDARAILKYVLDRNERNFEARVLDGELALELTPADARAARARSSSDPAPYAPPCSTSSGQRAPPRRTKWGSFRPT
ncbi:MAG: hypothetical protein HZB38_03675 [Planctomycetes bacterium]|nr:hypothetical protein [Planctomycetota bacterium]